MVAAIQTKGLTKRYRDIIAVDDLDLDVRPGGVYGFLGLNGAGKTTTVSMLCGVLPPTSGRAVVDGVDVWRDPKRVTGRIGVVFGENLAPEPGFSPVRYLRHFGRLHGLTRKQTDERARALFDVLALGDDAERPIGELSGGNRRKVELARALLHGPRILFLDEPTRELDIPAKRSVWQFIQDLVGDGSLTVFLSSHDAQEIATLCTRIGIIRRGRLTWDGTPDDLTRDGASLVEALSDRLEGKRASFGRA